MVVDKMKLSHSNGLIAIGLISTILILVLFLIIAKNIHAQDFFENVTTWTRTPNVTVDFKFMVYNLLEQYCIRGDLYTQITSKTWRVQDNVCDGNWANMTLDWGKPIINQTFTEVNLTSCSGLTVLDTHYFAICNNTGHIMIYNCTDTKEDNCSLLDNVSYISVNIGEELRNDPNYKSRW